MVLKFSQQMKHAQRTEKYIRLIFNSYISDCDFFFKVHAHYWHELVFSVDFQGQCALCNPNDGNYVFWRLVVFAPFLIKSPKQTKFGRLIVFAPFLIIIIIIIIIILFHLFILLSFFGTWTCPWQISGTTGQNFMKLGGVIDICF